MIITIQQGTGHGIRRICAVLQVPRSSYYHAAEATTVQSEDVRIGDAIERIFKKHKRRYGYRRIGSELLDEAIICAPARVRRLMAERGLKAIQPKSYVPRTSDGRADKPSANLLLDQPIPERPDCAWAGDITHIPTSKGWLYLAIVIDLCTRRIVGWALADHMRAELAVDALKQALGSRPKSAACIFHSDRGSQYGSKAYRHEMNKAHMRQSMSARANPYHNAWSESVIGTLKSEMLQGGRFIDQTDARTEIFAYIEGYYNTIRKHSALRYLSPLQFETHIQSLN
jgi:transposase InsO family protein